MYARDGSELEPREWRRRKEGGGAELSLSTRIESYTVLKIEKQLFLVHLYTFLSEERFQRDVLLEWSEAGPETNAIDSLPFEAQELTDSLVNKGLIQRAGQKGVIRFQPRGAS